MPTYITLWEYTQQGIENVTHSPDRIEEVEEVFESAGGELKEFYLMMGQYDTVTISEFPDDETASQAILGIARQGNASPETHRAFSWEESRELSENVP